MTHIERWEAIKADCRRAKTMAINYNAPGKGVTFIDSPNLRGSKRRRIPKYELTGTVRGQVAVYC